MQPRGMKLCSHGTWSYAATGHEVMQPRGMKLCSHGAWSYAATSSLLFLVVLKMEGKTIVMSSSKVIRLMLLVVSPKKVPLHHHTASDKFFFNITEQHWFPTKSVLIISLYLFPYC